MTSKIGEKLRNVREGDKVNIELMSNRLAINKNTLGAYERGERLPDIDFLITFSDKTGEDFLTLLELRLEDSQAPGASSAVAIMDSIAVAMEELSHNKIGKVALPGSVKVKSMQPSAEWLILTTIAISEADWLPDTVKLNRTTQVDMALKLYNLLLQHLGDIDSKWKWMMQNRDAMQHALHFVYDIDQMNASIENSRASA